MGCLCSKVMVRSMSLKEDFSQSLQGGANGLPVLEELFISSDVVCTFYPKENKSHSPDAEPVNTETAKPWELVTGSKEQGEGKYTPQEAQKVAECADFNMTKRSKSCHWSLSGRDVLSLALGISNGVKEVGFKWSNKGVGRCRSFHTVEEYDATVERIWLSGLQQTGFDDVDAVSKFLPHNSETSSKESDHCSSDIQVLDQCCQSNKRSAMENPRTEETGMLLTSAPETKEVILDTIGEEPKRKAIAKKLRSLSIPTTIEFPAIASLREWLPVGQQTHSPGAYDTPKFGTYDLPVAGAESENRASLPFSPELVAAFEESMKQFEAEEESILLQIGEQLVEDSTNGKEP